MRTGGWQVSLTVPALRQSFNWSHLVLSRDRPGLAGSWFPGSRVITVLAYCSSPSTQLHLDLASVNISVMEPQFETFYEVGFSIKSAKFFIRVPSVKLRRPRFWRRKQKISSASLSSNTPSASSLNSSSSPSDDWIRDFHERYNPLNTSTPVRCNKNKTAENQIISRIQRQVMNCSGVKIYEDYDDLFEPRDEQFDLVNAENNRVIARLMFSDIYGHTL